MKAIYPTKVFYPAMKKGGTPREFDHSVEAENPLAAATKALLDFQGKPGVQTATVGDVICLPDLQRWFIIDSGKQLREVSGNYARTWMRETGYMDRIFGVKAAVESHVVPSPNGGRAVEVGASAGARDFDYQ